MNQRDHPSPIPTSRRTIRPVFSPSRAKQEVWRGEGDRRRRDERETIQQDIIRARSVLGGLKKA